MLRSLIHFRRVNAAVALGAAVAAAVLTGALLVGDSVRGSLRDLVLDRLGSIDEALLSESFFREALATELEEIAPSLQVAPAILLQGSAVHAESGARASGIQIVGVDERFIELFPPQAEGTESGGVPLGQLPGQIFASAVLNASLAEELGAVVGEAILLSYPRWSEIPSDTLLGGRETEDVVGTLRCMVTAILPDRGLGRFGLSARQTFQKSAFVDLGRLQRALGATGKVNAAFFSAGTESQPASSALLDRAVKLDDLGLTVVASDDFLTVSSQEFVLRPRMVQAVESASAKLAAPLLRIQTYLANRIAAGQRSIPYSMMAALELPVSGGLGELRLVDGTLAPRIGPGEVLLNRWAADDLEAGVGDRIDITYFQVSPREEFLERTSSFEVRGITAMEGLGVDPALTPEYPGIEGARDIRDWDPPFPVDLDEIRREDEDYWDLYRGSPKVVIAEESGKQLWANRFGTVTAIRIAVPEAVTPDAFEARFRATLLGEIDVAGFGLRLLPVRQEGLEAARGATDFSMLFLSFSMFLIVSALLLVSLLFRLGVEQRAGEIGLLLSTGYRLRAVRRRFLAEGTMVAAMGVTLGLGGAVLYAWLMMVGLRTLWLPAVGSPLLFLHIEPLSLVGGGLLSLLAIVFTISRSIRRLSYLAPTALLAGSVSKTERRHSSRLAHVIAYGGTAAGVVLLATAISTGQLANPGLFFGMGAGLLCGGLGFFALWCRQVHGGASTSLAGMAARNSSWNPGRSILSVALVGSACFSIISVGAFRLEDGGSVLSLDSGAGGFALVAESDVPLPQDPGRRSARADLGFSPAAEADLEGVTIVPFRALPGDDTSCLNLYRPGRPRILGVPPEQVERGGFPFGGLSEPSENPWTLLEQDLEPGVVPALGDDNSVKWILHSGLGKELVLEDERGEELRLRFVGLLKHSLFQSEILISEKHFLEHFPSRSGYSYFLIEPPAGRTQEITETLESALAPFGFDATSSAQRLADFNAIQNTYLSTFQTLGGLGLLLGTVGLGIILVRNIIERRGELAALRAFGFRRRRLALLVIAENAFLLVFGISLGTLSALVAIAPVLFGESSRLPWFSLLGTLAVVFLVGMLASAAAVLGTLRVPLLPALKAER